MANICKTKITVIGLKEPAETFVKVFSNALFGIDLENPQPKQWGEDSSVDRTTWYANLVNEYRQHQSSARYYILYPREPYNRLGVSAPRFYVETKNGPPVKELREASKAFPDLTFHLDWWLLQDGPSGELVVRNGDDIDEIFRPASWYLFDHTVLYPRISLLAAHLPYTLAQRASLRVQDAIQTINGLTQILDDSRFTGSPYANERDPAALEETKRKLDQLLAYMKNSAERLSFEGVFLGVRPFRHQDTLSSPSKSVQDDNLDIDEL